MKTSALEYLNKVLASRNERVVAADDGGQLIVGSDEVDQRSAIDARNEALTKAAEDSWRVVVVGQIWAITGRRWIVSIVSSIDGRNRAHFRAVDDHVRMFTAELDCNGRLIRDSGFRLVCELEQPKPRPAQVGDVWRCASGTKEHTVTHISDGFAMFGSPIQGMLLLSDGTLKCPDSWRLVRGAEEQSPAEQDAAAHNTRPDATRTLTFPVEAVRDLRRDRFKARQAFAERVIALCPPDLSRLGWTAVVLFDIELVADPSRVLARLTPERCADGLARTIRGEIRCMSGNGYRGVYQRAIAPHRAPSLRTGKTWSRR